MTPLTDLLQKAPKGGDKLSEWFNLSLGRGRKGVYRHGMVDKNTAGGVERREEEMRDSAA